MAVNLNSGFIGKRTKLSPREGISKYIHMLSLLKRLAEMHDDGRAVIYVNLSQKEFGRLRSSLYSNTLAFQNFRKFLKENKQRLSVQQTPGDVPGKVNIEISVLTKKE